MHTLSPYALPPSHVHCTLLPSPRECPSESPNGDLAICVLKLNNITKEITVSYIVKTESTPATAAFVESKVSCSRCGEQFEEGQLVRDDLVYCNTGELEAIEHLHDPPCKFKLWG